MKRDQHLVSLFLSALNNDGGKSFKVVRWPDDVNRQTPAIEAVARDDNGHTLAIEHTLIQPFEGARIDDNRFIKIFGALEGCTDLMKPGHNVDIAVKVGAIPNGVKWENVASYVRKQLTRTIPTLGEAETIVLIEGLPFALPICLSITSHGPVDRDHVWIGRSDVPPTLRQVVRTALERKLPKLVTEKANCRVLLLEQADCAHGHSEIRSVIDGLSSDFPELKQVHEIWLAVTTCWETEDILFFYELFPEVMGRRLKMKTDQFQVAALGK